MDISAADSRDSLHIVRVFKCSQRRLWAAIATPAEVLQWFGPEHAPATEFSADVRVGGRWRACLREDGSRQLWVSGVYEEILPPHRLQFSFRWEGDAHEDGPGVDTRVTILLIPLSPDVTRLELHHADLASAASANGHEQGWLSCLQRLARHLSGVAS